MKVLVIGRSGQVAQSLLRQSAGWDGVKLELLGRSEFDLEQPVAIAQTIVARRPDAIINTSAYTAVDRAEQEPQRAFAINRDGAGAVAEAAARIGAGLIHLSTDYVFSGRKLGAYAEADETGPLNSYGRSKLAGEVAVLSAHRGAVVIRTSWVYSPFGSNFVKTMLRLGAEKPALRIVNDQFGNPTSALDLAGALLRLVTMMPVRGGIFHLSGEGSTSWYGLAQYIFQISAALAGPSPELEGISTADYGALAERPMNSVLDCSLAASQFRLRLPTWQQSVAAAVSELLGSDRAPD